ncbi:MAG TPA: CsgG/HfaB family protein [Desulfobacterales bacterium]|nr:CsgG/HfaB family protein [Desulfobacterales bacterium]
MKKVVFLRSTLAVFLALILCGCATTGKSQYDIGMQLGQAGKEKESIAYLEQAIANEPRNTKYQQALADLKERLADKYVTNAAKALESETPLTIAALNKAKEEFAHAQEIHPTHSNVINFQQKLNQSEQNFLSEIKSLHTEAKNYIEAGEWLKAHFNLQQVQSRFPNYEDSFQYFTQITNKGPQAYYEKAKTRFDDDDLSGAKDYIRKALSIKGDHQPSRELMAQVNERDNKDYFIQKAKNETQAQHWDQAIQAYQKAIEYSPDDQSLVELASHVKAKAGDSYIQEARNQMEDGWLFKAYENYNLASKYSPDQSAYELNTLRNDLCSWINYTAEKHKTDGNFGSAWYWYKKIQNINPDYPKIFFLTQEMEDQIKQRVKKSIAVFDFGSPSDVSDAGIIVANNLITFLFKTASGDIKILERENLKSILEEMKLGQIGIVSSNSAKEMGRVYGIDVAIMGSVLLYKVDSSSSEGTQTVRYQVGTKIEDNITYLNWVAKHPNPSREELEKAPSAKVTIPEYTEKDYIVSKHKKIGFVQISFRIVDVSTGENIQVKTIERKTAVEDESSAGVPEANIKFDPVEIPSDTELLQTMTEEVVTELAREALRPLQNLEKTYYEKGDQNLRRRDNIVAAENFVNAVFDEKMKMIQDSTVTQISYKHLDNIFLNYKVAIIEE